MFDPLTTLALAAAALAGLAMIVTGALRGWSGWLDLQRQRLGGGATQSAGARIELADLRERVRKLEAIAAGIDL